MKYFLEAQNGKGDNKNKKSFSPSTLREMFIINHLISEKKKLCLNEVRQSIITHEITDSKVLSHKKAHKDAQEEKRLKKKPERIMNIMYNTEVSLFKLGKYPAEKGKRVGENLVRRLEW